MLTPWLFINLLQYSKNLLEYSKYSYNFIEFSASLLMRFREYLMRKRDFFLSKTRFSLEHERQPKNMWESNFLTKKLNTTTNNLSMILCIPHTAWVCKWLGTKRKKNKEEKIFIAVFYFLLSLHTENGRKENFSLSFVTLFSRFSSDSVVNVDFVWWHNTFDITKMDFLKFI